ncbi:unnamed protein product, partial [marine sediment metagenome]
EQRFLEGNDAQQIGPAATGDSESGVDAPGQGSSGELQTLSESDPVA